MKNKTLFTKRNQASTLLFNSQKVVGNNDLLARKQKVAFLNKSASLEENLSLFTKLLEDSSPAGLLILSFWEQIQGQIQTALEVAYRKEVYLPVQPMSQEVCALTKREEEVLRLLATGKSYKTIAQRLSISLPTVKFHMKNLYIKLNVSNREDASEWARQKLTQVG